MYTLLRVKDFINEYNARIVVDFIYNRRKNNREPIITLLFVINEFLVINLIFITQTPKKRGKSIKIIIKSLINIFTSITRRSERLILIQYHINLNIIFAARALSLFYLLTFVTCFFYNGKEC